MWKGLLELFGNAWSIYSHCGWLELYGSRSVCLNVRILNGKKFLKCFSREKTSGKWCLAALRPHDAHFCNLYKIVGPITL